ncbi:GNAT family acetyltransferase YhhY [Collimonas arenae]|uniref:GNAT family acetyltransferase YhhY n=1 Tax=Collimonas arenae TaxID=279058 RepID=A0A0A1FFE7_9BURK|nr:GNAT family N-acetyltransferase [Collimonas arenae]AIY41577.1 GNAT family acetyltransferase YhhY [Collimonas arenae]
MFNVVPIRAEHAAGFREAVDVIARERIHLGQTEARSLLWFNEFVANNIKNNYAEFVALDGDRLIGWCDVLPHPLPGFGHGGTLGMGVLEPWRGRGVGDALLAATIERATTSGITRVELEVYARNAAAIALYRKHGFVEEGVKRKARFLDGRYDDVVMMALLIGMQ